MADWRIYTGTDAPGDALQDIPPPPPWRMSKRARPIGAPPADLDLDAEKEKALSFRASKQMIRAVNTALYLRRPLLLTGKPGTGKSSLISSVAYELRMGPVLRWPINSRSTVRGGVYEYDAIGRLQEGKGNHPIGKYLTLGPLGTALLAQHWPRALLIDEIDKSDLDFANDLLNVIEEGEYEIPELRRLGDQPIVVRDAEKHEVPIRNGQLACGQYPLVVMTSNGEREFPGPFLRRCVQLKIDEPDETELAAIVSAHLSTAIGKRRQLFVDTLIKEFMAARDERDVSTDQLLNAVFLAVRVGKQLGRSFDDKELESIKRALFQQPDEEDEAEQAES